MQPSEELAMVIEHDIPPPPQYPPPPPPTGVEPATGPLEAQFDKMWHFSYL